MSAQDKLAAALWEADRHAVTLSDALTEWQQMPGIAPEQVQQDRALIRLVDQILYRFAKLQDSLGERLVPATLAVLAKPYEDQPMRDRLNRLEKLGFIDVNTWLAWRELRNRLAHEYPEAAAARLAALQATVEAATALVDGYQHWRNKVAGAKS